MPTLTPPTIEKIFEQIPFNPNTPWKLCRVPVDQVEPLNSPWNRIQSTPGIFVGSRSYDGTFYRVSVNIGYIHCLRLHEYKFVLDLDPLEPDESEVRIQGIWVARCNAEDKFLNDAVEAILVGRGLGLESVNREIVPQRLRINFEWVSLSHDILASSPQVKDEFAKALVFISLNLLNDYDTPAALALLEKDQYNVLQIFREIRRNPFPLRPMISVALIDNRDDSWKFGLHWVSIVRKLLEYCGGRINFLQDCFDPSFSGNDNANRYGTLLGTFGSIPFGKFDLLKMRDALSTSVLFAKDISALEIATMTIQMMNFLPFDYPAPLHLPLEIRGKLSSQQFNQIRVQMAYIYHQQPSLQTFEDSVKLLLVWGSIDPTVHLAVIEWTSSIDGWRFYEQTIKDIQKAQTNEKLGLTIAALLYYLRGSPPTSVHITKRITGSCLLDFNTLLNGNPLDNTQTILECVLVSFMRVLKSSEFRASFRKFHQFLATAIDANIATDHPFDEVLGEYWARRIELGCTHEIALQAMKPQFMIEATAGLSVRGVCNEAIVENGEEEWVKVPLVDSMRELCI